ncbi:hypothetical protein [Streptomyces violascens]|uniref:Uncharacterized protein n=1 Tax=Streptomyces violascens TaxID=67381 RepID=A0ABQ3QTC7_9ACTN|nr:hypothetical protein [Streptomyces violascens]GHI40526.1 hypothetical protein Sviol_49340 [Streptomyces violascens]
MDTSPDDHTLTAQPSALPDLTRRERRTAATPQRQRAPRRPLLARTAPPESASPYVDLQTAGSRSADLRRLGDRQYAGSSLIRRQPKPGPQLIALGIRSLAPHP